MTSHEQQAAPENLKYISQPINMGDSEILPTDTQETKAETLPLLKPGQPEQGFRLYQIRFLMLLLFVMAQANISIQNFAISPIASNLTKIYNKTSFVVDLASMSFFLGNFLMAIPATFVLDTYGIRYGVLIGATLCLAGVWMKSFLNHNFLFCIFGQFLPGLGRPFIVNAQGKFSATWFSEKSRGMVTNLATAVTVLLVGVGGLIPGLIFKGYDPDDKKEIIDGHKHGKELAEWSMQLEAYIVSGLLLPAYFLLQNQPKTPPSRSSGSQRPKFGSALKDVFTNRNFLFLFFIYILFNGIFNCYSILLAFIIEPFGFKATMVSIVCVFQVFFGFVATIFSGVILRKTMKYKAFMFFYIIASMGCLAFYLFALESQQNWMLLMGGSLSGIFAVPLAPLMFELGIELTYPNGESVSVGMQILGAQLFGFIFSSIFGLIIKGEARKQTYMGMAGFCLVYVIDLILLVFMKVDLKRSKVDIQYKPSILSNHEATSIVQADGQINNSQKNELDEDINFLNSQQAQNQDVTENQKS